MSSRYTPAWMSGDGPNWWEMMNATLVLVFGILILSRQTISWSWLIIGFVVFILAMGPVAASSIGAQIGEWFRSIGGAGRAIAIIAFAVVIWTDVLSIPATPALSFGAGGMFATIVMFVIWMARSRGFLG